MQQPVSDSSDILQNLHFADNSTRTDASNKGFKINPISDHLDSAFQDARVG